MKKVAGKISANLL